MAGLIHIYCGDGKGKTTAALGLAVRAAGSGKKVLLLQFFKDGKSSEFTALQDLQGLEVIPQTRSFGFSWTLSDSEKKEAAAYYSGLLEAAFARAEDAGLLVLDEVISSYNHKLLPQKRLLEFLQHKPAGLEVVLTGRQPAPELAALADYLSDIRKIKHPYDQGIAAREGIEK